MRMRDVPNLEHSLCVVPKLRALTPPFTAYGGLARLGPEA
jgi:hypothetical protein